MKKKIKGRFLLVGLTLSLLLLIPQILHCLDQWKNDYKAQAFDSFFQYFFEVSGGILLMALAGFLAFACFGIWEARNRK